MIARYLRSKNLLVVYLLSAYILSGCSTPAALYLLDHRFQKPYTTGGWGHGNIGIDYGGATRVETVKDINATPPADSGTDINARGLGFSAGLNANFGLLKSLD
ncbi:MAG: hypothetical protein KDD45_01790, partial [Bdellovibrionales bacterium]|nr:hypothetical protein [Bdellovibrionales bacterium]